MQPMISYLKDQIVPTSKVVAKKLKRMVVHFILQDDMLYKRGFASPMLQCIREEEAIYIMRKIHEGICGNHSRLIALAHKVRW